MQEAAAEGNEKKKKKKSMRHDTWDADEPVPSDERPRRQEPHPFKRLRFNI